MNRQELKELLEKFSNPLTFDQCYIVLGQSPQQRSYSGADACATALRVIEKYEEAVQLTKEKEAMLMALYMARNERDAALRRNEMQAETITAQRTQLEALSKKAAQLDELVAIAKGYRTD